MKAFRAAGRGFFVFLFLPLFLPLLAWGGDNKEKKAYELIYEDVQLLKQKLAQIEAKLDRNAADIQALQAQFKDFLDQWKVAQGAQASLKEDVKAIPAQSQVLSDKLDQINLQLAKIIEDLMTLHPAAAPSPETTTQAQAPGKAEKTEKKEPEKKPETEANAQEAAAPPAPPPSDLSPQEVYNTAYSDYLKGNFDLASEGFRLYREQFPESPLADNALYWIGECFFSQRKFEDAIGRFDELILNYPQSDKIAAAYLKKGLSLVELGRKDEAVSVFKLLVSKFPLENETKVAQQKIKDLTSQDERY